MSAQFEQIRIEPAYRKVAGVLLKRITTRSLAAGERLPAEAELARQFGVNRSTVREALRELETKGLLGRQRGSKLMIVTRPEHRAVADGVTHALALHDVTFMEVWEALGMLEPPLAEVAAKRRKEKDLRHLTRTATDFVNDNDDATRAVEHVAAFFLQLGAATHNTALMLSHAPLIQLLAPSLGAMIDKVPQARARIITAQRRILDAVRARDAAEARAWMSKHIRDFKKGYEVAKISLQHRVASP